MHIIIHRVMVNITNKLESYLKIMSQSDYFLNIILIKSIQLNYPSMSWSYWRNSFCLPRWWDPGPGGWQMSQQVAKHSSLLEDLHFFRQFSRQLSISAWTSPDVSIIITTTSMKKLLVQTPFASIVEFLTTALISGQVLYIGQRLIKYIE